MNWKFTFEDMYNHVLRHWVYDMSENDARRIALRTCALLEKNGPGRGWAYRVDQEKDIKK